MSDGKTPRVWKLDELSHGYNKKGEDSPSIGGLHPHCRCTLVTLMPGYGFSAGGFVQYKKAGYSEYNAQHELERSEDEYGEPLRKAGETNFPKFDPSKHPRDPQTGEFVDHEAAFMDSLSFASKSLKEDWAKLTPEQQKERIAHSKLVLRAILRTHPEEYAGMVKRLYLNGDFPLDRNGNIPDMGIDRHEGGPERFRKTLNWGRIGPIHGGIGTIHDPKRNSKADQLLRQIRKENVAAGYRHEGTHPNPLQSFTHLMYKYKHHSNGMYGQVLKYLAHRDRNFADYADLQEAEALDEEFDKHNNALRILRGGKRGTQQRLKAGLPAKETSYPATALKHHLGTNIHVYHPMLQHTKELQDRLRKSGLLYSGPPQPGQDPNVQYGVFARSFLEEPTRHHLLSSFADTVENARPDPLLAGEKEPTLQFYLAPISAVRLSFHHQGILSYANWRRSSENEHLLDPHDEIVLPHAVGLQHIKEMIPAPPAGVSGKAAHQAIPESLRGKDSSGEMLRPDIPYKDRQKMGLARSEDNVD